MSVRRRYLRGTASLPTIRIKTLVPTVDDFLPPIPVWLFNTTLRSVEGSQFDNIAYDFQKPIPADIPVWTSNTVVRNIAGVKFRTDNFLYFTEVEMGDAAWNSAAFEYRTATGLKFSTTNALYNTSREIPADVPVWTTLPESRTVAGLKFSITDAIYNTSREIPADNIYWTTLATTRTVTGVKFLTSALEAST